MRRIASPDAMLHRSAVRAMPQSCRRTSRPPPNPPATPEPIEPRFLEQVANACRVGRLAYRSRQGWQFGNGYAAWQAATRNAAVCHPAPLTLCRSDVVAGACFAAASLDNWWSIRFDAEGVTQASPGQRPVGRGRPEAIQPCKGATITATVSVPPMIAASFQAGLLRGCAALAGLRCRISFQPQAVGLG